MNTALIRWTIVLAAVLLAGCKQSSPDASPAPVALVESQAVAKRTLKETISAYGTTEFATADATTLTVQVESQVAQILVTSGSSVQRGQVLLRLVPSATTRLDLGKAKLDADAAVRERDRVARLRADGLVTEGELRAATNAAASAVALRNSLGARTGPAAQLTLRATRDGIVDALSVQPGDVLAAGAVAARIAPSDSLQVRLGVEPHEAQRVAAGQFVQVESLAPQGMPVAAVISGVDRRIDPQSRMIAALVRLPTHTGLLPGAALHAEIVVAEHKDVLAAPRTAVLYAGEQAYLYVVSENKAQRRDVSLGIRDGDWLEVTAGLKGGEALVTSGNSVLVDGMAVRTASAAGADDRK